MTKIIRTIAVIASCAFCAGLIWFSNTQNQTAIYFCIGGCCVSFLLNMMVTAHENTRRLEALQKQQEAELVQENSENN